MGRLVVEIKVGRKIVAWQLKFFIQKEQAVSRNEIRC